MDAIVYAYIKSRMNYKTSIADNVTEKEISEKLGISLSTVKRSVERLKKNKNLIDKVISNNVIAEGSYKTYNKYHVAKCNEDFSIIPDFKKDDTDTRIYHIIYDWCIDNGVVPPDRNDEITVMEDGSVRRRNRLLAELACKLVYMKDEEIRSLLTNRITSEEITLEYIAKVLNINNKKKEDIQYSVMLD